MSTANPTSTPKPTKKHQNQSKNGGKSKNESGSSSGAKSKSAEASADGASSSGGIFRPLVVLALPGVNLFRRFSQYKRLPQDPPKDKLEVELERLNSKIVSLFLAHLSLFFQVWNFICLFFTFFLEFFSKKTNLIIGPLQGCILLTYLCVISSKLCKNLLKSANILL